MAEPDGCHDTLGAMASPPLSSVPAPASNPPPIIPVPTVQALPVSFYYVECPFCNTKLHVLLPPGTTTFRCASCTAQYTVRQTNATTSAAAATPAPPPATTPKARRKKPETPGDSVQKRRRRASAAKTDTNVDPNLGADMAPLRPPQPEDDRPPALLLLHMPHMPQYGSPPPQEHHNGLSHHGRITDLHEDDEEPRHHDLHRASTPDYGVGAVVAGSVVNPSDSEPHARLSSGSGGGCGGCDKLLGSTQPHDGAQLCAVCRRPWCEVCCGDSKQVAACGGGCGEVLCHGCWHNSWGRGTSGVFGCEHVACAGCKGAFFRKCQAPIPCRSGEGEPLVACEHCRGWFEWECCGTLCSLCEDKHDSFCPEAVPF